MSMSTTMCPHCGGDIGDIFRSLASKGGKSGRGENKRTRTPEEYREMQRHSVEARRRNRVTD
jgi:hypothetical protein